MSCHFIAIRSEDDIFLALHFLRLMMDDLALSEIDKQKVLVSASELTRNILDHANGKGSFYCNIIEDRGIKIVVEDQGKGIDHLDQILNGESYKHRRGLGLGLAGAKRLMDEFFIETSKEGTKIVCIKWKEKSKFKA